MLKMQVSTRRTSLKDAWGEVISVEKEVTNEGEKIGLVRVEFSLASVAGEIQAKMIEVFVLSAIQAIACIFILLLLINRRLLDPINKLKNQANMLAKKSLDQPFLWAQPDEIGQLGSSLETTRVALKTLFEELEAKNADLAIMNNNLESLVAERTATIKMILDNVKSGLLLVDKSLQVQDGYSRSCEELLARNNFASQALADILGLNKTNAEYFKICVDQVFDDFMPEVTTLAQIPRRFKLENRSIALDGSTVRNAKGEVEKILFTITDITKLEEIEAENRSNKAVVKILQNITSFSDFINETSERINDAIKAIDTDNESVVRRELHTLKGNSAAYGIESVASLIHHIEDQNKISQNHIKEIETAFSSFLDNNFELFRLRYGEIAEKNVQISRSELQTFKNQIHNLKSFETLRDRVDSWLENMSLTPVSQVLGPLGDYIGKIAGDLGRKVDFKITGGDLRVDANNIKELMNNLIHLVRNSIDHGIERPEDRGEKPTTGNLEIKFIENRHGFLITIEDDGRGIDRQKVLSKAIKLGLIDKKAAELLSDKQAFAFIFSDGLSTADTISDVSGRGVGMKAVLDAVKSLGGEIDIESRLNKGTKFIISVPMKAKNQFEKTA